MMSLMIAPWLIPAAISALGLWSSSKQQGKSNQLNQQAVDLALKDYNDKAPLRDAFTKAALADMPAAPDTSSAFAAAATNPFYSAPTRINAAPTPVLPPSTAMGPRPNVDTGVGGHYPGQDTGDVGRYDDKKPDPGLPPGAGFGHGDTPMGENPGKPSIYGDGGVVPVLPPMPSALPGAPAPPPRPGAPVIPSDFLRR